MRSPRIRLGVRLLTSVGAVGVVLLVILAPARALTPTAVYAWSTGTTTTLANPTTTSTTGCSLTWPLFPYAMTSTGQTSYDVHADQLGHGQCLSDATEAGFVVTFPYSTICAPNCNTPTSYAFEVNWTVNWFAWVKGSCPGGSADVSFGVDSFLVQPRLPGANYSIYSGSLSTPGNVQTSVTLTHVDFSFNALIPGGTTNILLNTYTWAVVNAQCPASAPPNTNAFAEVDIYHTTSGVATFNWASIR